MKVVKLEKRSFNTAKSKGLATRLVVLERNFNKDTILKILKLLGEDKSFFAGNKDSAISFRNFYSDKNAVSINFFCR